jgi:hypothetical protein
VPVCAGPNSPEERALSRDHSSLFSPPETIGPYRVLHQVGAGVLGPVYRALEPGTDRQVGIKLFRLDATPEQAALLAGRLAALVSALPSCPVIATPLSAGLEGSSAYLALDYVAADSIDARLRRRTPTSLEPAIPLLRQVAGALEAAAAAGIYHGALHPRDVLVSTRGAVTLTGLGVVQALEAAGFRPPFRRPYAAPERVAGRAWDARADVFSLAVLALELATGRRPLLPESGSAWQWAGMDPGQAAAVRDVFARGLAEDPDERASSAASWVASLEVALGLATEAGVLPKPAGAAPADAGTTSPQRPADPGQGPVADRARRGGALEAMEASASTAGNVRIERDDRARDARDTIGGAEPDDLPLAAGRLDETADGAVPTGVGVAAGAGPLDDTAVSDLAVAGESARAAAPGDEVPVGAGERAGGPTAPAETRLAERHDARDMDAPLGLVGQAGAAVVDRGGAAWRLPAAVSLVVGVLAGFLAGYAVGVRSTVPGSDATRSGAAAEAQAPAAALATEERVTPVPDRRDAGASAPAVPPREAVTPAAEAPPRGRTRTAGGPPRGRQSAAGAARIDGRLLVRTSPPGAAVEVDGAAVGVAPLALGGLAPGAYRVRVSAPGYEPAERRVELTPGAPRAALAVTLRPAGPAPAGERASPAPQRGAAALAAIEIVSRPPRARVFLDGRSVGTTPLRVAALEPRTYTVRLELAGHRDWTLDVRAVPGRLVRVTASLEPHTLP